MVVTGEAVLPSPPPFVFLFFCLCYVHSIWTSGKKKGKPGQWAAALPRPALGDPFAGPQTGCINFNAFIYFTEYYSSHSSVIFLFYIICEI